MTEVAKKIGEQWKTLTDKEKKVRQIRTAISQCASSGRVCGLPAGARGLRSQPFGPPAPPLAPEHSRLGPTVSEECCAQKYNDKAEKDKARYASEMKKCDISRLFL